LPSDERLREFFLGSIVLFTPGSFSTFLPLGDNVTATATDANGNTSEFSASYTLTEDVGAIGNLVWEDLNADGLQDAGEPGLPNVTVKLYEYTTTTWLATTTTGPDGRFHFGAVDPGDYYLVFIKPAGYDFTSANVGTDEDLDSDADYSTGETDYFSLTAGEYNQDQDAGLIYLNGSSNTAPSAEDDSYETLHDQILNLAVPGVLGSDMDMDGDLLTAVALNGYAIAQGQSLTKPTAQGGSVTLYFNGYFSYTPPAGFVGSDSFTYTASDGHLTDDATVTIDVTNQAPSAEPDSYEILHDQTLTVTDPPEYWWGPYGVLNNDMDGDMGMDTLTVVAVNGSAGAVGQAITLPSGATLTMGASGGFVYQPVAGWTGDDTFTYDVSDGADTSTGTVTIAVTNEAPMAGDDPSYGYSYSVAHGQTLTTTLDPSTGIPGLIFNDGDMDGDVLTVAKVNGNSAHVGVEIAITGGLLTVAADGTFTFEAGASFTGTASFTYEVTDGIAADTASVEIWVTNDAPSAADDFISTMQGVPVSESAQYGLLSNDSDMDSDAITVTRYKVGSTWYNAGAQASWAGGALTVYADGSYDYDPGSTFTGSDWFEYEISDGIDTSVGTVYIDVM
jgi:hypothetical protein